MEELALHDTGGKEFKISLVHLNNMGMKKTPDGIKSIIVDSNDNIIEVEEDFEYLWNAFRDRYSEVGDLSYIAKERMDKEPFKDSDIEYLINKSGRAMLKVGDREHLFEDIKNRVEELGETNINYSKIDCSQLYGNRSIYPVCITHSPRAEDAIEIACIWIAEGAVEVYFEDNIWEEAVDTVAIVPEDDDRWRKRIPVADYLDKLEEMFPGFSWKERVKAFT